VVEVLKLALSALVRVVVLRFAMRQVLLSWHVVCSSLGVVVIDRYLEYAPAVSIALYLPSSLCFRGKSRP
jgi:hypothetical protein